MRAGLANNAQLSRPWTSRLLHVRVGDQVLSPARLSDRGHTEAAGPDLKHCTFLMISQGDHVALPDTSNHMDWPVRHKLHMACPPATPPEPGKAPCRLARGLSPDSILQQQLLDKGLSPWQEASPGIVLTSAPSSCAWHATHASPAAEAAAGRLLAC